MVDESVTVKGSPVRSLQKFIDAELAPEQKEAVFRSLPPEFASRFRSPILATETVPLHMLNRFTEEAARAAGQPVEQFARRAGRAGAEDAIKGVYRFFAMVMTPSALIEKASKMWSGFYHRGTMEIAEQTDRSVTVRVTNFPAETAGCARIGGWAERAIEMTGAKNVRAQHGSCMVKGGKSCDWKIVWS